MFRTCFRIALIGVYFGCDEPIATPTDASVDSGLRDASIEVQPLDARALDGAADSPRTDTSVAETGIDFDATSDAEHGDGAHHAGFDAETDATRVDADADARREDRGVDAARRRSWRQILSRDSPSPRYLHSFTYDSVRERAVLFGGEMNGGLSRDPADWHPTADTWEWDGATWTRSPTANAPHPDLLSGAAAAYHEGRGQVIVYGGQYMEDVFGEYMWGWNGATWENLTGQSVGPGFDSTMARMVYDSGRNRLMRFGGRVVGTANRNIAYEWDGSSWTSYSQVPRPANQRLFGMVYKPDAQETILFGLGTTVNSPGTTWRWRDAQWRIITEVGPSLRNGVGMVYDSDRRTIVLFGGDDFTSPEYSNEVWEWNGSAWAEIDADGDIPGRAMHGMVYDSARHQIVVFGGQASDGTELGDTWVLE